jgi:hypothetical protein
VFLQAVGRSVDRAATDQPEHVEAKLDAVGLADPGPADPAPVDEGPVAAGAVRDLEPGERVAAHLGVVARHRRVPDDDVIVGAPAQAQPAEDRVHRLAPPGPLPFGGVGARVDGNGRLRPGPAQDRFDAELLAAVRVAEAEPHRAVDAQPRDPSAVLEGAVGAAGVLHDPSHRARPQHQVPPRDQRMGHAEVGVGVAADGDLDRLVDHDVVAVGADPEDRIAAHRREPDLALESHRGGDAVEQCPLALEAVGWGEEHKIDGLGLHALDVHDLAEEP